MPSIPAHNGASASLADDKMIPGSMIDASNSSKLGNRRKGTCHGDRAFFLTKLALYIANGTYAFDFDRIVPASQAARCHQKSKKKMIPLLINRAALAKRLVSKSLLQIPS